MEATFEKPIPELIKQRVKGIDPEARVILFGSRARGDWGKNSDWDFLILLHKKASEPFKREIRDSIYEIELDTDEVISTIIENEVDWLKYEIIPLFKIIEKEGIEV